MFRVVLVAVSLAICLAFPERRPHKEMYEQHFKGFNVPQGNAMGGMMRPQQSAFGFADPFGLQKRDSESMKRLSGGHAPGQLSGHVASPKAFHAAHTQGFHDHADPASFHSSKSGYFRLNDLANLHNFFRH